MVDKRYMVIRINPGLSVEAQGALAQRVRNRAADLELLMCDDFDQIVLSGERDLERLFTHANRDRNMIAVWSQIDQPTELGYVIFLDQLDVADSYATVQFANVADMALVSNFLTSWNAMTTTFPVSNSGIEGILKAYIEVDAEKLCKVVRLNIASRTLWIVPTWAGHKTFLDHDRLSVR